MKNKNRLIQWAMLLLLALPVAGQAEPVCSVTLRGELPLVQAGNRHLVAVQIDHKRAMMLVDSGASHASLDKTIGDALALYQQPDKTVNVSGVGGKSAEHPYITSSLVVGPVMLIGYDILPINLTLPSKTGKPIPVGLIGSDILSRYDVEFDFPEKIMRFYEVSNCSGRFIPWTGEYQDVHAMRSLNRLFIIPVGINGHVVRALVDTGSTQTVLSQDAFNKAHLSDAQRTGKSETFYGSGGSTSARQYKLDKIQIGRSEFRDVVAYVQPESYGEFDMLVGMDFMRWRKVWLSYKTEQVFMQAPEKKKP